MSLSNTSEYPSLSGGLIKMSNIKKTCDLSTRHTKLVCTLGPACWEVAQLEKLLDGGMNIARLNFSHGDHESHLACLKRLREAAKNKGRDIGMFECLVFPIYLFIIYQQIVAQEAI